MTLDLINDPDSNNRRPDPRSTIDVIDKDRPSATHTFQLDSLDSAELAAIFQLQSRRLSPEHQVRLSIHMARGGYFQNNTFAQQLSRDDTASLFRLARRRLKGEDFVNKDNLLVIFHDSESGYLFQGLLDIKSPAHELRAVMRSVQAGDSLMPKLHRDRLAEVILESKVDESRDKARSQRYSAMRDRLRRRSRSRDDKSPF